MINQLSLICNSKSKCMEFDTSLTPICNRAWIGKATVSQFIPYTKTSFPTNKISSKNSRELLNLGTLCCPPNFPRFRIQV
jgi:hypothetical protein